MSSSRFMFSTLRIAILMGIAGTLLAQEPAPARGGGGRGGGQGGGAARGAGGGAPAAAAPAARGGGAAATRAPLFFKEEWKNEANTYEPKIEQIHLSNPNLEIKTYGPTGKEIVIAGTAGNETNPLHPWTGMCTGPCGLTLKHKTQFVDLTGLARIKWNTKMSGLHQVHPLIKLASGVLLVGDFADGIVADWQEREFSLSGIKWFTLDPELGVTKGAVVANPDLTKVDEVGFFDPMPASGHGQGGWADVAKFEVYGKPVPR
jgi:hypothetical protein